MSDKSPFVTADRLPLMFLVGGGLCLVPVVLLAGIVAGLEAMQDRAGSAGVLLVLLSTLVPLVLLAGYIIRRKRAERIRR